MKKAKSIFRYLAIGVLSLILVLIFLFIPENPYLSNYLKKLILPEIQSATGYPATADKIYLHVFPLYAGIKNLRLVDEEGDLVMRINSVKVYPELTSFLTGNPVIRRISVKEPYILMNHARARFVKDNLRGYSEKSKRNKKILIKHIGISKGEFFWKEQKNWSVKDIKIDGRLREEIEIIASGETFYEGLKKSIGFRAAISIPVKILREGTLEEINIKDMILLSGRSEIDLSGRFHLLRESQLRIGFKVFMEDIIETLSLRAAPKDKGYLRAKGVLIARPWGQEFSDFLSGLSCEIETVGDMRLENLMEILSVKERLSGDLRFNAKVGGKVLSPVLRGEARLRKGNLFGIEIDDLNTEVVFKERRLFFSNAHGELYGGKADAEAEIPIPVHDFRLHIKAEGVRDKAIMELIGLKFPIPDGIVDGEFAHAGKRFSPAGWFLYRPVKHLNGKGFNPLDRIKEIKASFNYDGENRILNFIDFAGISDLLFLKMKGFYRLEDKYTEGQYTLRLLPEAFDSDEFSHLVRLDSGNVEGEIKGFLPKPVIKGSIVLNSVFIKGYSLELIKGTFFYNGSEFEPLLTGTATEEEHRLSGSIRFENSKELFDFSAPSFNLRLQLKNMRLKSLIPESGLKDEIRVDGEVKFRGDNLSQGFEIKLRRLNSRLDGSLALKRWKEYEYEVYSSIKPADLGLLNTGVLDTAFRIRAKGNGSLPEINGFLSIHSDEVRLNGRPLGLIKLDGVIERNVFAVAGSLFDGLLTLKAQGNISPLNYRGEIEFRDASYKSLFQAFIKDAPEDINLDLKGILKIERKDKLLSGALYFERFIISGLGHELRNKEPVQVELKNNRLMIRSLSMVNEGATVAVSGVVNMGEAYDLELKGSTYLWPFKRFSRSIKTIKGKVDFGIMISGKWDSPQFSGDIALKDGTLSIEDIPYQVTEVNSLIRFNENRVNIEQFSGKIAGGSVDARGIAYLRGFRLGRFNMEVTLRNISATLSEDFSLSFDSTLYLKGERYLKLITGEVRLRKAFYRRYIEWRTWMLKGKEPAPQPEVSIPTFLDAALNIKITGPLSETASVLMIDNNIANAKLKVDFLLKGTLKRPVLLGRIETLEGVVYFRNNELKLINAAADFTNPERIDPYFKIRAETFSRGYRINLLIEGHLRKFNLSLSSEPPLDEVDIIALLAVGETGTALKGYGGGIGAAEASSFLTGQLQETIEQRARLYTGIDRVQISPYVSKTGEIGPRVTVGKKLGDRLSILYSSAVGSKESDVIKIEYELNKKVFLVGEKDERGSMGGDIKFRFQFR